MSNTSPNLQSSEADKAYDAMIAEQAAAAKWEVQPEQPEQVDISADAIGIVTRKKIDQISPLEACAVYADRLKNEADANKRLKIMWDAAADGLVELRDKETDKWAPAATKKDKTVRTAQSLITDAYITFAPESTTKAPEAKVAVEVAEPKAESIPATTAPESPKAPEAKKTSTYDQFKTLATKEQFAELATEMFDTAKNVGELKKLMRNCEAAQIIRWRKNGEKQKGGKYVPSARWGSVEYKKIVMDTIIDEYYTRLKAMGKPKTEVKKVEKVVDKNEAIKSEVSAAVAAMKAASTFRNSAETGILDILDAFDKKHEKMIQKNERGYYDYNRKNNWAKPLVEAANAKIKVVKNYRWAKDQENGFHFNRDGNQYAFLLDIQHGEGSDIAKVSKLAVLTGEAPFKNGNIPCVDLEEGSFLDWAADRMIKNPPKKKTGSKRSNRNRK